MKWIRKFLNTWLEESRQEKLGEALPVMRALHDEHSLNLRQLIRKTNTNAIYARGSLKFLDRQGLVSCSHGRRRSARDKEQYTLTPKGVRVFLGEESID